MTTRPFDADPRRHGLHARRAPSIALAAALGISLLGCASAPAPKTEAPSPGAVSGGGDPAASADATLQPEAIPGAAGNPFLGARFYIDPEYVAGVESSAAASPADAALLRKVAAFPTAIWIDTIAHVGRVAPALADARRQERAAGQPVVPVFVVYNLPDRDCAAAASSGELTAEKGGEERYRTAYIDKIAAQLQAHAGQRIVAIIEPDSLANIATNLSNPRCAAAEGVYRRSVAYAIAKLSRPNVSLYLDAAHAGWLGWAGNRGKIAQIYKEVLDAAGGTDKIRGFCTNVSNYNVLVGDGNRALEPSNPCPDETTYVRELSESLMWAGIKHKAFIVDTGRNGRDGLRSKWGSWCNVRGAGLGERPRAAPSPLVDAYYWVKPPGRSDGTSDSHAPRFDAMCAASDAVPGAPQADGWFHPYFVELAKNANPPL